MSNAQKKKTVFVCQGTGCVSGGSIAVYDALKVEAARNNITNVEIDFTDATGSASKDLMS